MMNFATVILAAGASSRMGQPKLLLPWGDKTILAHLVQQWTELGSAQIAVVIEPKSPLEGHLGKTDHIANPNPELGMFSSIRCAARWSGWRSDITHFVVNLGDQPHVGIDTLKAIINFATANPDVVCQPSRKGRPRHPVVMPRRFFLELVAACDQTLKSFLQTREPHRKTFESLDAGLDLDIDTLDDYQKALNIRPANTGAPSS